MPICREGKFLINHDLGIVSSLGIETNSISECVNEIIEKPYKGIFGSPSFGFNEEDLNFLSEIPFVTQVWLFDINLKNIDGLYSLKELAYLGVNPKRPGINFGDFPHLETLISDWNKNDTNLRNSNVKKYNLWHFKPKSKSFVGTEFPKGVAQLEIYWSNTETLEGLEVMESLTELGIYQSRNLVDLCLLPVIAPNLKKINIEACGKLKNYDGILNHPSLEVAWVGNKKILS